MSITKKHILSLILLSILMKVIYVVFALTIKEYTGDKIIGNQPNDIIALFQRNDSFWYMDIAKNGYAKIKDPIELGYVGEDKVIQSSWAMFPLYPMTIKFIATTFHLNLIQSAFIISLFFSSLSFILFYIICTSIFQLNPKTAWRNTLIFIVFPFHYYFSMYYTEAMYFCFLAIGFLSVYHKKYLLTFLSLIPLTLIRPNGIVSVLPIFLFYLEKEGGYLYWWNMLKTIQLKKIIPWFWFISAPIALLAYCIYQKEMTNFYFAYVKAQEGWYKEFMFPLLALFRNGNAFSQFNSIYTVITFIFCLLCIKKLPVSLNVLIWLSLLLPLSSGSVVSMPRFISVLFPITMLISQKMIKSNYIYLITLLLLAFQLWSFYPWLYSNPFSF
jgi:hypothetical protein